MTENSHPTLLTTVGAEAKRLCGLPLWSVIGGNGSRLALDFGRKVPRDQPLTNSKLSEEQRLYEAECSLFVECPWSLLRAGAVAADWEDDYDTVDSAFSSLRGATVRQAELSPATGQLTVTFSTGERLRLINDQVEDGLDGYSLFTTEGIWSVGAERRATYEARSTSTTTERET
jgi:hypothetical protein